VCVRDVSEICLDHSELDLTGFDQPWIFSGVPDVLNLEPRRKMIWKNFRDSNGQRIHDASQDRGHTYDCDIRLLFRRAASTGEEKNYREERSGKCKRLSQLEDLPLFLFDGSRLGI
jgi:hypothetical protein